MKGIFLLLASALIFSCGTADEDLRTSTHALCAPSVGYGDSGPFTFNATDGSSYEYYMYVPTTYDDCSGEFPLVLNFHGGGQTAFDFKDRPFMTEIRSNADTVGAVLIWIDSGSPLNWWNDSVNLNPGNNHLLMVDEFAVFAKSMLRIDDDRVHAIGFSNGAMFTQHLAARRPALFASVVAIAGTSGSYFKNWFGCNDAYNPACPFDPLDNVWLAWPPLITSTVDIMMIRGEDDDVVPVTGGAHNLVNLSIPLTYVLPAIENPNAPGESDYERWQTATGCNTLTTTVFAHATRYKCTGGAAEVRHAIVNTMDHSMPIFTDTNYDGPTRAAQFLWNHPK